MLLLTLVIAGLHLRQHRQPWPFILSVISAGSVFFAIYGVGWLPHAASTDAMGDQMADGMAPLPAWSSFLAYGAILVLLVAQVWDLWLYRQELGSCAVAPQPRKEGMECAALEGFS